MADVWTGSGWMSIGNQPIEHGLENYAVETRMEDGEVRHVVVRDGGAFRAYTIAASMSYDIEDGGAVSDPKPQAEAELLRRLEVLAQVLAKLEGALPAASAKMKQEQ